MSSAHYATGNLLILEKISKRYGSVYANRDIDLTLQKGEIHALLGENGAGKSTLAKILSGLVQPTSGKLLWCGKPIVLQGPQKALEQGIGIVSQHSVLFDSLTVLENVLLGLDSSKVPADFSSQVQAKANHYGLDLDPQALVLNLSPSAKQRVEILRCLMQKPRLILMDEPTSLLSPLAIQKLFKALRQLAAEGCGILYISHKLDEIRSLCDTATILRNGQVVSYCILKEETEASLARLLIEHEPPSLGKRKYIDDGEVTLKLSDVSLFSRVDKKKHLDRIGFELKAGEILGIAGLSGNGQKELLAVISGELRHSRGHIYLGDLSVDGLGPRERRLLGLGFAPEERLGRGAVPAMSLDDNTLLTLTRPWPVKKGLIKQSVVSRFTRYCIDLFKVKSAHQKPSAEILSGGNLQKFIVGRELLQQPKVLLLSQPTWGVDIGSAAFILKKIMDIRDEGTSVLVVSEELDQLFDICDRLAVMSEGRLSPIRKIHEYSKEEIGVWMSGLWANQSVQADLSDVGGKHAQT